MLRKKSKFLAIGLAALGVIGAGSVAFATWLVGVQQTERDVALSVLVDETQDVNIRLTANLQSTELKIAEKEVYDNSAGKAMLGTDSEGVEASALTFGFSELKLVIGEGVTKQFQSITVTCAELYPLGSNGTNLIQVRDNKEGSLTNKRTTVENLKYINLPAVTLTADDFVVSDKTYTLKTDKSTTDKFTFTWGDYFENKSPVNYYNDIYANKGSESNDKWTGLKTDIYSEGELDTEHTHIIKELEAMHKHFEGKTLTLKVKANFTE